MSLIEKLQSISIGGVSLTEKTLFARHLAVMLKAGISIGEALQIAGESTEGKLQKIIRDISRSVQSGNPLSSAFRDYPHVFSGLFINATYAGEASGTLASNLEVVAARLEKERMLREKVKGALFYPMIVLIAAVVLGVVLSFVVLPKLVPLFTGLNVDLPITTRMLIAFTEFIQAHGMFVLIGGAVFGIFLVWLARQDFVKPVTHKLLLSVPVIRSISKNSNLSRFSGTLGTLLKSGIHIDEALQITAETLGNYHYKKALRDITERIGKGTTLSQNLSEHHALFPILAVQMVKVGEESGNIEETLFYLSSFYDTELDTAMKQFSTAVEPALLLIVGLGVGFIALSIITPIYDITSGFNR